MSCCCVLREDGQQVERFHSCQRECIVGTAWYCLLKRSGVHGALWDISIGVHRWHKTRPSIDASKTARVRFHAIDIIISRQAMAVFSPTSG